MKTFKIFALGLLLLGVFNQKAFESVNLSDFGMNNVQYTREAAVRLVAMDAQTTDVSAVVKEAAPSVVQVNAYKTQSAYSFEFSFGNHRYTVTHPGLESVKVSSGSGFFVTSDGYLITNKHVVADPLSEYRVNLGDSEVEAQVIYRDPDYDLAVLKVQGDNFKPIAFADSSNLSVGDQVVSIGNALGRYIDSVSEGRIAAVGQEIVAQGYESDEALSGLIETDAKLYPGDSGGPLLNSKGEAVGVNVATVVGESLSFSIPSNIAKEVMSRANVA